MGDCYFSKPVVKEPGVDLFIISSKTTSHKFTILESSVLTKWEEWRKCLLASYFFSLALRTSCLYNDPEMSSMEKE